MYIYIYIYIYICICMYIYMYIYICIYICLLQSQRFGFFVLLNDLVYLSLTRFCFSVPYALCVEKKQ